MWGVGCMRVGLRVMGHGAAGCDDSGGAGRKLQAKGYGVWAVNYRPWPVTCYLWPVACGLWPVPCGLCPVACALCPVPCALCPVASVEPACSVSRCRATLQFQLSDAQLVPVPHQDVRRGLTRSTDHTPTPADQSAQLSGTGHMIGVRVGVDCQRRGESKKHFTRKQACKTHADI